MDAIPKASFRGGANQTHRAMTLLDEPPLIEHNEVVGHTRASVDPDDQVYRREARETDGRHRDCHQTELSQFGNTDVFGDRTILGCDIDGGALASRRTTVRTLLAAATSVRAAAGRSLRATTAGLSTFTTRRRAAGRRSTFRQGYRRLQLVQPGAKQVDFPVGATTRLMRHPAPQSERHHCQDQELPQEKHLESSAVCQPV